MSKIIMSWSKCKIEFGKTGVDDAMATALTELGTVKNKSTSLTTEDGEALIAVASGGVVVAKEEGEHSYKITTRIMEMPFEVETALTGAVIDESGDLVVSSNVISDDYSVKVTPKNIGSTGIKVRRSHVSFKPGTSEEEGQFVDVTFEIMKTADNELYRKFKVKSDDWE